MTAPDASSVSSPRSDRDIQRSALTDLIALAADCAAEESQIEREYRSALEKEKQAHSDRNFKLDDRFKNDVAQTNQAHRQRTAETTGQYQSERGG